ncbi:hypothetical protein C7212DRAFT_154441, partial [Tuber magnatum]
DFNIYMDNYISAQVLLIRLRELGIGVCSIVRVNTAAFPLRLYDDRKSIP